ncbi:hypothetical protein ACKWTF_005287 [Chironomus riparius]
MDTNDQKKQNFKIVTPLYHNKESISLDGALNLISSFDFDNYIQQKQIIEIDFKINEELDEKDIKLSLKPQIIAQFSALITFQSTIDNESRLFWKTESQEFFKFLEIGDYSDGFVTKLCQDFLIEKLQKRETGILANYEKEEVLNPLYIGNKDGHNLLSIAVIQNNHETVEKLLFKYEFDVDYEIEEINNKKISIIDLAWRTFTNCQEENVKISNSNIIFSLLIRDAKFPQNFNCEIASAEIQKLVDDREELHECIQLRNYELLREKITSENYNVNYYYDKANQSLLMNALKMIIDSDTFEVLTSLGLNIANHEEKDAKIFFQQIRNKNRTNAKDFPETHIFLLVAKTKIANYNHKNPEYSKQILEAYKTLDENDSCSNVLKVVATCDSFKIFFDFKHDITYYFDPLTSIRTKGVTYSTGEMQIGVKNLLSENKNKKHEVLGVIIHEFCHLAVLKTYLNNYDPYLMGESKDKARFIGKVVKECRESSKVEGMIDNVFNSYPPEHYHSEIIVLVCQMLMHYCSKDSKTDCEHFKIIRNRKLVFPELFKYFKEIVEPELVKVLPVLKKLHDDDQEINFQELTEPMKAKILNGKINFQGEKVSLFEIIENDEDILNLLNSDDIRDILLYDETIRLGEVCKQNTKYGYIERSFNQFNKGNSEKRYDRIEEFKNIDQIINDVTQSKIFILAAKAGEGKSATFENLTKMLKSSNKNYWVSFVKLRKYRDIFEQINIEDSMSPSDIFKIFVNIIFPSTRKNNFDINSKFRIKIFQKLFDTGKMILLLDGIDEICPKFNQHMINILNILRKDTSNQLWVSTRPQHVEQLTRTLGANAFTLRPYDKEGQNQLILNICVELNINYRFSHPHLFWFLNSYKDFNNPMLIIIVSELYIKGKIDLKNMNYDYFGIFKLLVDEQFNKIELKVDIKDRNPLLNFLLVHQVLALKFIFNEEEIKDLQIIKKWKREIKNWSSEKIQRFGFVVIDLKFLENDNKSSIDFIHYSIAEFFVAQYIIDSIFDEDRNDKEIEHLFELIQLFKLKNTSFLLNFLKNHWVTPEENMHRKLITMIMDEIEKCSKINVKYGDLDCLHFWCPFLKNEPELLKNIWQVNHKKTLLNKIIFSFDIFRIPSRANLLDFVYDCLGENWHEVLNKSCEKLMIDDQSEINSKDNILHSEFRKANHVFKNFYKLLILVEKTFDAKEKEMFGFAINVFINKYFETLYGGYFERCFDKILKNHVITEVTVVKIVISIIGGVVDCNKLNIFQKVLENFYKNDRKKIGEILFSKYVMQNVMNRLKNNLSIKDSKEEFSQKFKIFFDVYDKYKNSREELQCLFLYSGGILELLKNMPTAFIPEFLIYVKTVFGSNNDNFSKFVSDRFCAFTTELLLILEDFLIKYFDSDEILVKKFMRELLYSNDKRSLYIPGDNLEKLIELRRKYQNSIDEFQEYLKSWTVLSSIFFKMADESYPFFFQLMKEIFNSNRQSLLLCIQDEYLNSAIIESKEKFLQLEQFFNEFFPDNRDDATNCLRKIILNCFSIHAILTSKLNDKNEFERIKNILFKYRTKEEIRDDFVSKNVLFFSFKYYSLECHKNFLEFIREIFEESNNSLFSSEQLSRNSYSAMDLIKSKREFKYFEKFLIDFYRNDHSKVKKIINTVLFNESIIEKYLYLLFSGDSEFQNLREIYTNYKNSWTQVQNIFTSLKNLLEIFTNVDEAVFPVLQEFLIEVFESEKSLIFNCFNYKEYDSLIKRPDRLKLLEKFLQKFTNNDENKVRDCIHNILFNQSKENFNPLVVFVKTENIDKLEYLIKTYKKYKNSWEELQNLFTSKPLSNLYFRYMSDKTYPIMEEFIREIFDSNKSRLIEIELTIETTEDEFEDYFYDKANEKHFIKKFNEFSNSINQSQQKRKTENLDQFVSRKKSNLN